MASSLQEKLFLVGLANDSKQSLIITKKILICLFWHHDNMLSYNFVIANRLVVVVVVNRQSWPHLVQRKRMEYIVVQ